MVRRRHGLRVTGVEATLLRLAHELDGVALEIACEDARRRRLTSIAALHAYLDRFGASGRPGIAAMRRLLGKLDRTHPSRSTLEVLTRRLLVAHGITEFTREFPLAWMGRTYLFDFAFERQRTILETNGDGGTTIPPTTRRPREVERPGPPRLPRRVRDLGQGHASRARVPRR